MALGSESNASPGAPGRMAGVKSDPSAPHVLALDAFVTGVVDGTRNGFLFAWADDLARAVRTLAERNSDPMLRVDARGLGDLLDSAVRLRRAGVNPFADFLEAPPAVILLFQEHGERLAQEDSRSALVIEGLIRDAARSLFTLVPHEVTAVSLSALGAQIDRPDEPFEDDVW